MRPTKPALARITNYNWKDSDQNILGSYIRMAMTMVIVIIVMIKITMKIMVAITTTKIAHFSMIIDEWPWNFTLMKKSCKFEYQENNVNKSHFKQNKMILSDNRNIHKMCRNIFRLFRHILWIYRLWMFFNKNYGQFTNWWDWEDWKYWMMVLKKDTKPGHLQWKIKWIFIHWQTKEKCKKITSKCCNTRAHTPQSCALEFKEIKKINWN